MSGKLYRARPIGGIDRKREHRRLSHVAWVAGLVVTLLAAPGCALRRGEAVPRELTTQASVPGIPNCRIWANDTDLEPVRRLMLDSIGRERAYLEKSGPIDHLPPAYFLAISGGGADGAYGAGIICAWT